MSRIVRKPDFLTDVKTKAQISFAVTVKLISPFVLAAQIVKLYRPVCPGRKFSRVAAHVQYNQSHWRSRGRSRISGKGFKFCKGASFHSFKTYILSNSSVNRNRFKFSKRGLILITLYCTCIVMKRK